MKVNGAVVVITGASGGIGRATALVLASGGASLVLAARHGEALSGLARSCELRGAPAAVPVPTDVTDPKAVDDLARQAVERFGRIDVWVNDAAVTMFAPFQRTPLPDFRRVVEVDQLGYVYGARAALPQMRAQGWGTVINIGSLNGILAAPYAPAYSMSKAAVRAFAASLRAELWLEGRHGIRVCTVMPASVDTRIFQHAANYTGQGVRPVPPVYTPHKVARAIANLIRVPRREVIVGPAGRAAALGQLVAPGLTERLFASYARRTQLSRQPADDAPGNLYEPAPDTGEGAITGGWSGARRTLRRALAGTALATAGFVLNRRRSRAASAGR